MCFSLNVDLNVSLKTAPVKHTIKYWTVLWFSRLTCGRSSCRSCTSGPAVWEKAQWYHHADAAPDAEWILVGGEETIMSILSWVTSRNGTTSSIRAFHNNLKVVVIEQSTDGMCNDEHSTSVVNISGNLFKHAKVFHNLVHTKKLVCD